MIDQIQEVYERLNIQYTSEWLMPDKTTRQRIKDDLEKELSDVIAVKCDEENNSIDIVDEGCVVAKVMWKEHPGSVTYKYCNLIFGNPFSVVKVQELLK